MFRALPHMSPPTPRMGARLFDVVVLGGPGPGVWCVSEAELVHGWALRVDFGSRSGRFSAGERPGSVVFRADAPLMCAKLSLGAFSRPELVSGGAEARVSREGTAFYSDREGDGVVLFCGRARVSLALDALEASGQLSGQQMRAVRAAAVRLGLSGGDVVGGA